MEVAIGFAYDPVFGITRDDQKLFLNTMRFEIKLTYFKQSLIDDKEMGYAVCVFSLSEQIDVSVGI